jgi:hypothetical protein
MELKEFIKTALSDITNAVSELQTELQNGAIVSPSVSNPITNVTVIDPQDDKINRPISKIDFDVAITVGSTDNTEAGGKIGIQIFSAKLGGNNESHTENVSRITFSIPVVLPNIHVENRAEWNEKKRPKRIIQADNQNMSDQ